VLNVLHKVGGKSVEYYASSRIMLQRAHSEPVHCHDVAAQI